MQAVILAGGRGTRISEESLLRPKPLIEIGERPIIWHIMKHYSYHGINEFMKNIPDDYKYKKTIVTKCEIIKDKLFYAAPEFIGQVFYMMHTLQEFLDEKEPWYEDAWSYIENSKIEAKKMM